MIEYYNKLIRSYIEEVEALEIAMPALETAISALEEKLK